MDSYCWQGNRHAFYLGAGPSHYGIRLYVYLSMQKLFVYIAQHKKIKQWSELKPWGEPEVNMLGFTYQRRGERPGVSFKDPHGSRGTVQQTIHVLYDSQPTDKVVPLEKPRDPF